MADNSFIPIITLLIPFLIAGVIAYFVSKSHMSIPKYARKRLDDLEDKLNNIESKLDNIEKLIINNQESRK